MRALSLTEEAGKQNRGDRRNRKKEELMCEMGVIMTAEALGNNVLAKLMFMCSLTQVKTHRPGMRKLTGREAGYLWPLSDNITRSLH